MSSTMVRISEPSHRILRELARQDNKPMQVVLDQAIEAYRRQRFLAGLDEDFSALRERDSEWRDEEAERAAWDTTLADGDE